MRVCTHREHSNNQDVEMASMSISRPMDKQNAVIWTMEYYSRGRKSAIRDNMDEPGGDDTEGNQAVAEGPTLPDPPLRSHMARLQEVEQRTVVAGAGGGGSDRLRSDGWEVSVAQGEF